MSSFKRFIKRNSHNVILKQLAGLGRSVNRLYENRNHDIYSNGELTVIKKISKFNPEILIDGGANIGNYSLFLDKYNPNSKIFAFEPVKDTFEILKTKTQHKQNIIPVNKGLFSDNCNKEINIFSSNTHSSIYDIKGVSYSAQNTQNITLIKGDDFFTENNIENIDFLKLDLEGAEYDAILGFENFFKNKKIRLVQFEYGYINISSKKLLADFYSLFNDYGYIVGKIFPKIVEFRDYKFKYEDFIGPNFIALKKDDKELIDVLKNKK